MSKFSIEIDGVGNTAYIKLAVHNQVSTRPFNSDINFDFGADGQLCGIEFLSLAGMSRITPQDLVDYLSLEEANEVQKLIESTKLELAR